VSLQKSTEVLQRREQLETLVIHIQRDIRSGVNQLETMRQELAVIEKHASDIETSKGFEYEVVEANEAKSVQEQYVENLGTKFLNTQMMIFDLVNNLKENITELQGIAACPSCLTNVQYLELLIQAERDEGRPGFQERLVHLNNQKDLAMKINEIQKEDFTPFETSEGDKIGHFIDDLHKKNFAVATLPTLEKEDSKDMRQYVKNMLQKRFKHRF